MKLNTVQRSVTSSGMSVSVDFSIDSNNKSFSVLSDGMYSDVVSSIVRELSSNCYDAHVAAGKTDVPFTVYCPSAFDPHFGVKDVGTGISYYQYTGTVTNKFDGESAIFIKGDIRDDVANINLIVLNHSETIKLGNVLYDTEKNETVLRIPGNWEGDNISVEFDNVLVLYSTYFRSTKEQSNDFIGAFGLGSKTPLAYTDNFIVVNRFNGVERIYNVIKNQEGRPQINLMSSGTTDECNGLEVKLAVDPDDYSAFKSAITEQLKYFSPLPTVYNDTVKFPVVEYVGTNFIMMKSVDDSAYSHRYRSGNACVGNNAYEINNVSNEVFSKNLVLKFNVGEVMVTSSREKLKYDDATITIIQQREQDAIAEYTKYILDSIDGSNMTDCEKAAFLNENTHAIALNLPSVIEKVGNSQYNYTKNVINIPITGWGDYSTIHYVTETDDNGNDVTRLNKRSCGKICALNWTQYLGGDNNKTERLIGDQYVKPLQKALVFILDVRYAFLKKISHYIEANDISFGNKKPYTSVLILDSRDTTEYQLAVDALKEMTHDALTLVKLSDIQLPKTFTTSSGSGDVRATPTARLFKLDSGVFDEPKLWVDIYDPLTKIDQDAYIVQTHHCAIENVSYNDQNFFKSYLSAGLPIDKNIVVLAMSRVKYDKALTYGFKSIMDLITKLKQNMVVSTDLANYSEIQNKIYDEAAYHNILKHFSHFNPDELDQLNPSSLVVKLNRINHIIKTRYIDRSEKYDAISVVLSHIGDFKPLVPSPTVVAAIDKVQQMCDNLTKDTLLISGQGRFIYTTPELKQALIQYINMLYPIGENA